MTACVNKKHSRRVAAAVSASLVGALTLGAAPAVVLATEAPVEQQVAGDAFSRGEVALTGGGVTKDARNMYTTTADKDGKALEIKATTVTPLGADPITVDDSYTVSYYKADDDFNKVGDAISAIVEPGKYLVAVSDGKAARPSPRSTSRVPRSPASHTTRPTPTTPTRCPTRISSSPARRSTSASK